MVEFGLLGFTQCNFYKVKVNGNRYAEINSEMKD